MEEQRLLSILTVVSEEVMSTEHMSVTITGPKAAALSLLGKGCNSCFAGRTGHDL